MSDRLRMALWAASGPVALGIAAAAWHGSVSAFFMVLLCAALGPMVGLASDAPYFTLGFKLLLASGLTLSALLLVAGTRFFGRPWGKVLLPLGAIGWTLAGGLGFGPQ